MKYKYSWSAFIFAVLTLVPFRIYQKIVLNQDAKTFLSIEKVDVWIVAAFFVFVITINYMLFVPKDYKCSMKIRKNLYTGALAMISGGFLVVSSVVTGVTTIKSWIENNESLPLLELVQSESAALVKEQILIQNVTILRCVLGIVACVGFWIIGMASIKGENSFKRYEFLTVLPTVWAIGKIIELLISKMSMTAQYNDLFMIISYLCITCFLFIHAKIFANIDDQKKIKKLFIFGFMSVISLMVYNLGSLVYLIYDRSSSASEYLTYICNLSLGLYITFFLFDSTLLVCNQEEIEEEKATVDN